MGTTAALSPRPSSTIDTDINITLGRVSPNGWNIGEGPMRRNASEITRHPKIIVKRSLFCKTQLKLYSKDLLLLTKTC